MTPWTHAAINVIENERNIFNEDEIEAVKCAWREAERMRFFGILIGMVENEGMSRELPITKQEKESRRKRDEEQQLLYEMESQMRIAEQRKQHMKLGTPPTPSWSDSTHSNWGR